MVISVSPTADKSILFRQNSSVNNRFDSKDSLLSHYIYFYTNDKENILITYSLHVKQMIHTEMNNGIIFQIWNCETPNNDISKYLWHCEQCLMTYLFVSSHFLPNKCLTKQQKVVLLSIRPLYIIVLFW